MHVAMRVRFGTAACGGVACFNHKPKPKKLFVLEPQTRPAEPMHDVIPLCEPSPDLRIYATADITPGSKILSQCS